MRNSPETLIGKISHNPIQQLVEDFGVHVDPRIRNCLDEAAARYKLSDLEGCIERLTDTNKILPNTRVPYYGIAVCLARMGRYVDADKFLSEELSLLSPNRFSLRLSQDIKTYLSRGQEAFTDMTTLTIFTVPKPFKGHIDMIQRNAIKSWLKLVPPPEIVLMGNEEGVAEVVQEFNLAHIPEIGVNEQGTPLISSIFELAQRRASNDLVAYVNTDIIFTGTTSSALQTLQNQDRFLVVGRRWDLDVWEPLDFDTPGWGEQLMMQAKKTALLHASTGPDYFIFRKGLYQGIPPFAVGRTVWDNWLIWEARHQGAKLIDATHAIAAFHQEHPYTHAQGGVIEVWKGVEARRNEELACGHTMTIRDADYCIDSGRIVPIHEGYLCPEPTRQNYIDLKFRQSITAYVKDHHGHALDLLEYIELNTHGCILPQMYTIHKAKVLMALGRKEEALDIMRPVQMTAMNAGLSASMADYKG